VGRISSFVVAVFGIISVSSCADASEDDEGEATSAGTSSSGGEDSTTMIPVVDYATQIQPIWNSQCTCHLQGMSGTMVAPTLTLNMQVSYDELVGTPSMAMPGLARIEPSDPDASYLWHKLHDTQLDVGGTGTEMPPGITLPEADVQLIEDWIRGGALP
jgi:hypothetical protein